MLHSYLAKSPSAIITQSFDTNDAASDVVLFEEFNDVTHVSCGFELAWIWERLLQILGKVSHLGLPLIPPFL